MSIPRAPAGLGPAGRRLWKGVVGSYDLLPHQLAVLQQAAQCLDRIEEARGILEREGVVTAGRFGSKPHPAVAIERDFRLGLLRSLRELSLDPTVVEESRPPMIAGRYRGGV